MDNLPTVDNAGQPTVWVDRVMAFTRLDTEVATLRFDTLQPDHERMQAVFRAQTSVTHLYRMIEMLCRHTDYYPERPGTEAESPDDKDT